MNDGTDRMQALWDRTRDLLERERRRVREEIGTYPTPIPRCDQQFNHLIDRRERLFNELAGLDQAIGSGAADSDGAARLAAFIDASGCLDEESKLRLKAALSQERAAPGLAAAAAESDALTRAD